MSGKCVVQDGIYEYMNIFRVSFQEDFKLEHRVSGTNSCILQSHHNMLKFENFSSRDYKT